MKRIPTLIWGSVFTNGQKFYLLREEAENPYHNPSWQPKDTLRWLVCSVSPSGTKSQKTVNEGGYEIYKPVYDASYLVFGRDAAVELLDDPKVEIYVDYFSSEDDDNDDTADAGN